MGFMDELKKLARPYSDEDEDFDDDFDLDAKSTVRTSGSSAVQPQPAYDSDPVIPSASTATATGAGASASGNKVVNLHGASTQPQMQVVLVKPDRFDAAGDIANHVREKHAVVLNLEGASKDVARRLVDFLSGCAFALDGKIKKVAASTYIIAPYNVDLIGDLLDELETNGMYI